jgi:hypothetical protein
LLLNRYKGFGSFEPSPFEGGNAFSWGMDGQSPTIGYRPAPWATPRLRADQFTVVSGKLPAIGTYPLIHGDTLYQVVSDEATQPTRLVRSSHRLLSYGQNIPGISWTYKGGSPVIQVSDTSLLMAGQYIGLNLPGYGMAWFAITGVFKGLGYVTTTQISDGISVRVNLGDRLTVYKGIGIVQEPYNFTSVTLQ